MDSTLNARATEAGDQLLGMFIAAPDETLPKFLASDGVSQVFADEYQQKFFQAIRTVWGRGGAFNELEIRNELGPEYPLAHELKRINENYYGAANYEAYSKVLWNGWRERELSRALSNALATNGSQTVEDKIADIEATITEIRTYGAGRRAEKFSFEELAYQFPTLNPPIVDGICREGETVNFIAAPKVGKSWLGYSLLLSIITGRDWLDTFPTTAGKCLLVDLELHPSTLAYRISEVAEALGIPRSDYEKDLEVWSLRGNVRSLSDLTVDLYRIKPGQKKFTLFDSKYRMAERGADENSNNHETHFYNTLDRFAANSQSAVGTIHHASKGDQSGKRVTDVGSGAGSQSRAADTHLVLREHEEEGRIVLDGVVRSFKPLESIVLNWQFPLWMPDRDADPAKLKGKLTAGEQRQSDKDREAIDKIIASLRAIDTRKATAKQLRLATGISKDRLDRLVAICVAQGHLKPSTTTIRGNECNEYQLIESLD